MTLFAAATQVTGPLLPALAVFGLLAVIWVPTIIYFLAKNPRSAPRVDRPIAEKSPLRSVRNPDAAQRRRDRQPRTPHEMAAARARPLTTAHRPAVVARGRHSGPADLPSVGFLPTQRDSSSLSSTSPADSDRQLGR